MRMGKEPSINKAYFSILNRAITIEEYEELIQQDRYYGHYTLTCEKCGDPLSYVPAGKKMSFFRHSPGGDNHDCCPDYQQGMSPQNTAVFALHKVFMDEEGISLNFELSLKQKTWSSLIALPPLDDERIVSYSEKDIRIQIEADDGLKHTSKSIFINADQFQAGVIRYFDLAGYPAQVRIFSRAISAKMKDSIGGFEEGRSLFSPLIRYDESASDALQSGFLTVKRQKASVFTFRHYLIFEAGFRSSEFSQAEADWTFIPNIPGPKGTRIYDVVFKQITQATQRFCGDCGCHLEEHEELVILWPPVRSVGNYRFFTKRVCEDGKISTYHRMLYTAIATDTQILDIMQFRTKDLFFGVKNKGCLSFYVTKGNESESLKDPASFSEKFVKEVSCSSDPVYLYKNGALLSLADGRKIALKKGQFALEVASPLSTCRYRIDSVVDQDDEFHELLKKAILYSLGNQEITMADAAPYFEAYKTDKYVSDYLIFCLSCHVIKTRALAVLKENINHAN
jgi:hypothetical protein